MVVGAKIDIGPWLGARHAQCILLFFCQVVMYSVLLNVPLAITAMVDKHSANPDFPEFDWNEKTKADILTSFYWGYMIFQIPYGFLAARYGGKLMLLIGVGVNSIANILIPQCTILGGSAGLLTIRSIQGIFQGVLFPATHGLLASWAPIEERSLLSVLVYPGNQIGSIIALITGGLIAESSLGWPGIFYIWGVMGLIWCVFWWMFGCNSPAEHKSISVEERDYIMSSRGSHVENVALPWKKIFTSIPFIALILTDVCGTYGFWIIINITPTYIKGLFGMNIKENAILSAIPAIGMFVLSYVFAGVGKFVIRLFKMNIKTSRILFNTIGYGVPGISLFALNFITINDIFLCIFLLTTAYGFVSAVFLGYFVNHMDLCPSHAGFLMGVTNSISTLSGIFALQAVGWLVTDESDPKQWQVIFNIGGACYIVGIFVFAFFGRFEDQNWMETIETPQTELNPKAINNNNHSDAKQASC